MYFSWPVIKFIFYWSRCISSIMNSLVDPMIIADGQEIKSTSAIHVLLNKNINPYRQHERIHGDHRPIKAKDKGLGVSRQRLPRT